MTYRGRVKNGQITLDESPRLPEGAAVSVEVLDEPARRTTARNGSLPVFSVPPDATPITLEDVKRAEDQP